MLTTVKFFAFLAEKTHQTEVKLNLQQCRTVGEVREVISSEFPEIAVDLATCMLAVNMEFQHDEDLLPEEIIEIAVIPPVSGG
ncbi:molybdopterin converting factor subunit 1 [Listeria cossartiae subsp. cayugensis]|uniref:Molybdopterin synthase sulfur carrier subunit n=1 Tax=Listeria cossartiae subsp. cayugensis TaxID=2713505 RepID=A0ABU2IKM1_9LIST|nr:molybdopterin converting factor subunit 1 [Listeria cossartiae]MDT0002666.1 molybdopterin converting factor subunit 1 [Listeria cossartiae subsp. cayugensis]MDT0013514.1 molybdopterin converting factor subunit 1 [Listeria cossartiae subsp. cayugensis]MDT0018966.1 molybdopterin converting factor subunit 1 [Listeria cossartiae subsp. cayugensis]MDT0035461.1 molybdopterin converting factor subunit 1 [Listeria cossartiae subsp. cayugensis]MDT0040716.1 molybdopterin converting factor subunit 1 [